MILNIFITVFQTVGFNRRNHVLKNIIYNASGYCALEKNWDSNPIISIKSTSHACGQLGMTN